MHKRQIGQQGFSVIEIVMVLVILGLLGAVGYLVHSKNHSAQAAHKTAASHSTAPAPKQADPYTGWKTGTMQYEQATFRYPSEWTLADTSAPYGANKTNCAKPGTDNILLTAPDGSGVWLSAQGVCGASAGIGTTIPGAAAQPITIFGQTSYLLPLDGTDGYGSAPSEACALTSVPSGESSNVNGLPSKHLVPNSGIAQDDFCYLTNTDFINSGVNVAAKQVPVATLQSSTSYKQAQLVFQSLSYK